MVVGRKGEGKRERETGNAGTLYDRPDRLSTRLKSIGRFFLFARKEERN